MMGRGGDIGMSNRPYLLCVLTKTDCCQKSLGLREITIVFHTFVFYLLKVLEDH